jgi:hypothetical protein
MQKIMDISDEGEVIPLSEICFEGAIKKTYYCENMYKSSGRH